MALLIPVSWGEVFDKITILEIKSARMNDDAKLHNIRRELDILRQTVQRAEYQPGEFLNQLVAQLKAVNETLWYIEDEIRECERCEDFGPAFVELARSVYKTNDKRADLKLQINKHLGSELVEEKSYSDY